MQNIWKCSTRNFEKGRKWETSQGRKYTFQTPTRQTRLCFCQGVFIFCGLHFVCVLFCVQWLETLRAGSFVDALDMESKWYTGHVLGINQGRALVHFDDWPSRFDEWVDVSSGRLAPKHTSAMGGRLQGGMPGWPLKPFREGPEDFKRDKFEQFLLGFE